MLFGTFINILWDMPNLGHLDHAFPRWPLMETLLSGPNVLTIYPRQIILASITTVSRAYNSIIIIAHAS